MTVIYAGPVVDALVDVADPAAGVRAVVVEGRGVLRPAVGVPKRLPRPAAAGDVARVLAAICPRRPRKDLPVDWLRDRVLSETIYVCGARAGEAAASTSRTWTCA